MIKSLHIKNFQSHENTCLNFDKGINIIIGPSDSGKSSIVRAFRWLIENKPLGDSIRSKWGGETSVSIETDEGKILRIKSNGVNGYELGPMLLQAIGTEVPKEVHKLLNMNEVNLQQQLESHFLLSKTPGEVGQYFNKIAHIDQVDKGQKNINKWIGQITQNIKAKEKQVKENNAKLKSFDYLDKAEIELEILEGLQKKVDVKITQRNKLNQLIEQITVIEEKIKRETVVLQLEDKVVRILNDWNKLEVLEIQQNRLCEIIDKFYGNEESIIELDILISLETKANTLLQLEQVIKNKKKEKQLLNTLICKINKNTEERTILNNGLERLEKEFHKIMPSVCPLCGNTMKKGL